MLSKHASARSQQRAIPPMVLDLLMQFGASEAAGTGVEKFFFNKESRRRLQAYAGPLASLFDEHLDVYAVVNRSSTTVITMGHRHERIRRN